MSEKITFGELIEAIAEETDNSKKFTHDFLKDFVDVINGGLKKDGNVNIAGFGKFKLRRVDEREGYNPQTDEKMTIPAHNKIVFKPYKDLRELVNAPYAHLEPELLEEDATENTTTEPEDSEPEPGSGPASTESEQRADDVIPLADDPEQPESDQTKEPTEKKSGEDDFIPTAPPTSQTPTKSNHDDSTNIADEDEENAPFDTDIRDESDIQVEKDDAEENIDDDNGDIVEFGSKNTDEDDTEDDFLSDFISPIESSEQPEESETDESSEPVTESEEDQVLDQDEPTVEPESEETTPNIEESTSEKSEEEILADEINKLDDAVEDLKESKSEEEETEADPVADTSQPTSTPIHNQSRRERSSSLTYVAAAVIILLLIAGGAWYYSTLSTGDTSLASTDQTTSSADITNQRDDSQQESADNADQDQQSAQTTGSQDQATATDVESSDSQNEQSTQESSNSDAVQIEDGQTLWSLAEERYGNPRLWPWIYGNNGSLEDPDIIYAGKSLSVPLPSGPQNSLNATDSVGVAKGFIATYKWYKNNEESQARNHLWAAKLYHDNIEQLADIPIDKADLSFANRAR